MLKYIEKIFGDPHERKVKKMLPLIERMNSMEEEISKLSDDELMAKTFIFRQKLENATKNLATEEIVRNKEKEVLEDLLPEAFATVREAGRRTLNMRHFDVQLMGGICLHRGHISEMKTGEGKTLVATSAAYLNALTGRGVHVITVNDYLARRDTGWMGQIYNKLGLEVGCVQHHLAPHERRKAYGADITYGTNNEFGFDYLRDNMANELSHCVQRGLEYAIVDEVDSILIDEARTPLIISGQIEQSAATYDRFAKIVDKFQGKIKNYNVKKGLIPDEDAPDEEIDCDYIIDEKSKNVIMTERGIIKAQKILDVDDLYGEGNWYAHHLLIALKAKELYRRDIEYVIRPDEDGEDEVVIVDEFTGRLMFGRRYSDGLHQAIEAKEKVRVQDETQTLATITFQNYFRMYKKLAGMTGTALTEEAEFGKIYNLEVTVIPPNRRLIRAEYPDVIYKTLDQKFKAAADEIEELYKIGRPVLVGTVSIEKSEYLANILKRRGVPHKVLNAKYHEKEAEIIAQAGRYKSVTIATNMAGRGTDILLGGNPEFLTNSELRKKGLDPVKAPKEMKDSILEKMKQQVEDEHNKVTAIGGLHIMGTERHESRRVDNQLRGRAGRQGDPGSSRFYLSLEDDLMRLFGGERITRLMDFMKAEEDMAIESPMVSKAVANAQKKVEMHNFSIRKTVLEYDDVLSLQRDIIYGQRKKILGGDNLQPVVEDMIKKNMLDIVDIYAIQGVPQEEWDFEGLKAQLAQIIPLLGGLNTEELQGHNIASLNEFVVEQAMLAYRSKESIVGEEMMRDLERMIILRVIDQKWIDHLHEMDALREGIGLRAYGQKDPLIEYKREGRMIFQEMMKSIREEAITVLFHLQIEYVMPPMPSVMPDNMIFNIDDDEGEQPFIAEPEIGRNDPCPCGSGKKYKKCCGAEETSLVSEEANTVEITPVSEEANVETTPVSEEVNAIETRPIS